MRGIVKILLVNALALLAAFTVSGEVVLDYSVTLAANAGDGDFAPSYIMSNRWGTITQSRSLLAGARISHNLDTTQRFSWGVGAEVWTCAAKSTDYALYNAPSAAWTMRDERPAAAWLQQAWAEIKYRSLYLTVGSKQRRNNLVSHDLSSGDLLLSGNARPAAGVTAGFIHYQDVPFTQGWVQASGDLGYYRPATDDTWLRHHYNHFNSFITTGYWLHFKAFHLRTKPTEPLVFTVGAQAASQFGGTALYYHDGEVEKTVKMKRDAKSFFKAIFAGSGGGSKGDDFVEGNHLGTWDMALDYRLPNGDKVRAYHQNIWEDGSGIGMLNGLDGTWGLEYRSREPQIVSGAVVEWVDLTNQSGSLHWAPADHEGTGITAQATGADDYYNNYIFNGYQSHGLPIGSAFVPGTIYNTDGYMRFIHNRIRGWHVALCGDLGSEWTYRLMASHRTSWGTPLVPIAKPLRTTSAMIEAAYSPAWLKGWQAKAQVAFDKGHLLGDNTGAMLQITYNGNLTF